MFICTIKSTVGCLKNMSLQPTYLHRSRSSLLTVQKFINLFKKTELYNTFQTIAQLKETGQTGNITPNWTTVQNTTPLNEQGSNAHTSKDTWYKGNTYKDNIWQLAQKTRQRFKKATETALPNYPTIMSTDLYEYHSGIYSSIFLSAGRSY